MAFFLQIIFCSSNTGAGSIMMCVFGANQPPIAAEDWSGGVGPRAWKCIYLIGEKTGLCISVKLFDLGKWGLFVFS